MKESFLIQIAHKHSDNLEELAVAMPVYKKNDIVSSQILQTIVDNGSQELAYNIANKLKKQVFLSCNIALDQHFRVPVEKKLSEEINSNIEWFTK